MSEHAGSVNRFAGSLMCASVALLLSFASAVSSVSSVYPLESVKTIVGSSSKDRVVIDRYFSHGLINAINLVSAIEDCNDWLDGDLITGDQGVDSKELLRTSVVFDTRLIASVKARIRTIGEGATAEKDVELIFIFEDGRWKIDEIIGEPLRTDNGFINTLHTNANVRARTKCK